MISMFLYNKNEVENKFIVKCTSDAVAHLSDDRLELKTFQQIKEAESFLREGSLLDAAYMDVTTKEGLSLARTTREVNQGSDFMVLADMTVSPMEYMTPSIRAASLLLRPYSKEQATKTIRDFMHAVYRGRDNEEDEKNLLVENRDGKISIPFSKIYYLEVREKRVHIRLKEKEYCKYDTLDNFLKELPPNFLRCHRSFVVNTAFIDRVKLSENAIYLEDDIFVPLSRSYKATIKEYMNGTR